MPHGTSTSGKLVVILVTLTAATFTLRQHATVHAQTASPTTATTAQTQPAATTGPSLADTTAWLSRNLVGLKTVETITRAATNPKKQRSAAATRTLGTTKELTSADFNGCQMKYVVQETAVGSATTVTTDVYSVPLDMITAPILTTEHRGDTEVNGANTISTSPSTYAIITLLAVANKNVITRSETEATTYPSGETEKQVNASNEKTSGVQIESDDNAMMQRVFNALTHAVTLCSATAKPNLF